MYKVELITLSEDIDNGTARKVVELPFVPFAGLLIQENQDIDSSTSYLDEYTVDSVAWNVQSQSFKCFVWFGVGVHIDVEPEDLEPRGWTKL